MCTASIGTARALERGPSLPLDDLKEDNRSALDEIRLLLDARTRDWCAYQRHANEFHRRNAAAWGNGRTGTDLTTQIDPDFDLSAAVTQLQAGPGWWRPSGSRPGRTDVVDWGRGGPNDMITLNALRCLRAAGRFGGA